MPRKTLFLIAGLVILTVVLLFVALKPQVTPPSQKPEEGVALSPTPKTPAYTSLTLSPNPVNLPAGATGTVNILIDSANTQGTNAVTVVQLELGYDPKTLTNVAITQGTFFSNPITLLKKIDTQTGRISFVLGITPAQSAVTGKGTVATLTFRKAAGATVAQTTIDVLPKTIVTAEGVGPSVLLSAQGTSVVFNQ